eukprot:TRINITY_DN67445_c2_g1_i1.p1 TRINITY_DN67445_c2_g1~~TRINITY_DN67445_c2_g1_i1.p1  ORF type:complete len:515 (+),score=66.54 TRINITY_DN67445_c2_g1_i1:141-1547(+)
MEEEEEEEEELEEEEEEEETEDYGEEVKLKILCKQEIRTLTITTKTKFSHLNKILLSDYGSVSRVTYVDEEGDQICVRNDHDLSQACEYYLAELAPSKKSLRLTLQQDEAAAAPKSTAPATEELESHSTLKSLPIPKKTVVVTDDKQFSEPPPATSTQNTTGPLAGLTQRQQSSASDEGMKDSMAALENTISSSGETSLKWTKGNMLGKGAFGTVHLGMLDNGQLIAVKVVELGQIQHEKEVDSFQHELQLMNTFKHPNIVRYLGCEYVKDENVLNIFLEYVPGGSLQSLIKRFFPLPEKTIRLFTRQILQGLHYLHSHGIVHRDIKGDNILVDENGVIKLADFGCSKQLNDLCSKSHGCCTMVGTPYWMAPEVITDESGYGFKADIWSVGCTVVEMMTGKPPWPEFQSMWAAIYHIANSSGPPSNMPENVPEYTQKFLDSCFERDVEVRGSAEDLLKMPFCAEIPDD